ncbi:MAG: SDR family oxidoreductase [Defluviimonas sp.]|nr:SDR family oxidoreductase [Defluviimonas sp.]
MRIVVVGGSGFIGARLVARLRREGHEVVTASRSTSVNTVTGDGLTQALADAAAVVDVLNPPPSGVVTSEEFFRASGRNIITAALAARVQHLIVLSVVGTDRLVEGDYFRGKLLQEDIAARSGIPCTILRATQFFEFMQAIAEAGSARGSVRVPDTLIQPAAADDVAAELVRIATEAPLREITELAGPEELPLVEVLRRVLSVTGIPRRIVADSEARYFGIRLGRRTLLPGAGARIAPTRLENWLSGSG